jgi:glucose/arabinose dehydrogenase
MQSIARRGGFGKPATKSGPVHRNAVAGSLLAAAILCLFFACGGGDSQVSAVSPSVSPQIALVPKYVGLSSPVGVTHAGDNTGKLYVVEQAGRIRLIDNGTLLPAAFLDISARVLSGGERGLLGLAFPPGYATSGRIFVNYTRIQDGATVIARFLRTANSPVADPNSEVILLTIPQPFANHNGGQLAFGPNDGFLYIGMGDGGSGGDPDNNAQNPASLLGKMLRIDVESAPDPGLPYAVPPNNPFVQNPAFDNEIWALGLRNPWRFSFDRQTGDLYIADVGQNLFEEVNFQPAASPGGENYGWRIMEGAHCFNDPACNPSGMVLPVAEYGHGPACSITGGFVYRGQAYPGIQGVYLYADFCSGQFWGLRRNGAVWQNTLLLTEPHSISSFGEDQAGNLYATDLGAGIVYEVTAPN